MSARNYKIYLSNGTARSDCEVRRFEISLQFASNFAYLREKIKEVFPVLREKRFIVTWKDSEGDKIAISSDEELKIALKENQYQTVSKFYIVLHEIRSNKIEPKLIHDGVVCDNCNTPVQGFRYKCIQCIDYDLCPDCEAQAKHPDHFMVRIGVPIRWSSYLAEFLATQMKKFMFVSCIESEYHMKGTKARYITAARYFDGAKSWKDTFSTYVSDWLSRQDESGASPCTTSTNDQCVNPSNTKMSVPCTKVPLTQHKLDIQSKQEKEPALYLMKLPSDQYSQMLKEKTLVAKNDSKTVYTKSAGIIQANGSSEKSESQSQTLMEPNISLSVSDEGRKLDDDKQKTKAPSTNTLTFKKDHFLDEDCAPMEKLAEQDGWTIICNSESPAVMPKTCNGLNEGIKKQFRMCQQHY